MSEKYDMTDFLQDKNASAIKVPDLDWLMLTAEDVKNIPVPMNIEIIPQLQENWKRTGEASTHLIPNIIKSEADSPSDKITEESIRDVVMAAKTEMMKGSTGKTLASKLASLYPKNLIRAAKDDLIKLAGEQGLLGKVYIDISPFNSCQEAARILGPSRIKLAKYVVGKPRRHVCSSHIGGYCKELRKDVIASMDYNEDILKAYTTHLRVAGMIGPEDVIDSKDMLRSALLKASESTRPDSVLPAETKEPERVTPLTTKQAEERDKSFANQLLKEALEAEGDKSKARFIEARSFISYIQSEMLKGKIGNSLKEVIIKKFPMDTIAKFASEMKKIASLQGLLGNVFVDVSYFDTPDAAIRAIKNASTNPTYIMQSVRFGDFDDTLRKVASITGCEVLPRDGKIDPKIACSYIDDLQYTKRISSDTAEESRKRILSGDSILGIIKQAYLSSLNYKPEIKEGGIQAHFYQEPVVKKFADTEKLKDATYRAVEAGFPIEKIEGKLTAQIPIVEAVGLVRGVLASVKELDANVLTKCAVERYQLDHGAMLKKASKCDTCILAIQGVGCTKQGLKFAEKKEKDAAPIANIDPHTEKVSLSENPDVVQMTIQSEYDMPLHSGENINIGLDRMKDASDTKDTEITFNSEGMDLNLTNL
jgi:hypothetical protein